jgi:hypothetical protein
MPPDAPTRTSRPAVLACTACGQLVPRQLAWSLPGYRGFRCPSCHGGLVQAVSSGSSKREKAAEAAYPVGKAPSAPLPVPLPERPARARRWKWARDPRLGAGSR